MGSFRNSTSLSDFWQIIDSSSIHSYTPVITYYKYYLGLISLPFITIYWLIMTPMNYKKDMTTKEYCSRTAEIDNSWRLQNGSSGELQVRNSVDLKSQSSLDCATDLPNSSEIRSLDSNNDDCSDYTHAGSVNHVYPNGWIPVMESSKVKPGTVEKAIIFGEDVIVTRSSDGKEISVLNAYCPHMGVHIGVGGEVKEVDNQSCVTCPFHGWAFRASDGQCVNIPSQAGSKCAIPKQAKLGTWTCTEVDNFIYVWHHIDGHPPSWFLEASGELTRPGWFQVGRSCHETNLELRDMHENGADMSHFEGIHNDIVILGGDIIKLKPLRYLQKYTRHHWEPDWKPILTDSGKYSHKAQMTLRSWITLFDLRLFDITVNAIQIGPAKVKLFYDSKWYGKGLLIMNAIPLGGRRTKYIQHIYTQRSLFQAFMAKCVLYGEIKMLERDFIIWNHKKNIKNPIFVPEDKKLKQFRRWYSQFYQRKRKIIIQHSESVI